MAEMLFIQSYNSVNSICLATHLWDGDKTELKSCRDCANFEDRREIERIAICAMNYGPSVCCPEFKPRSSKVRKGIYDRFCSKCTDFQVVNDIPICGKDHRPGVACGSFREKNLNNTPPRKHYKKESGALLVLS